MTVGEILALNKETLERFYYFGIKTEHFKCVELFDDYKRMKGDGDKVTYIVAFLAEKYGLSERKIYDVIKLMNRECSL